METREIRVFLSSTFRDMQDERQYLFDYVFPKLRAVAERRNVKIVEIDLRWGITYEESENGKVMQICFEEIERCRPYFIGLLGNRYGWCPDSSELEKNASTERAFPWVRRYVNQGKSVTEMEMQFGALCSELQPDQEIKASFFLKEDSPDIGQRQKDLKQLIRRIGVYPYRTYHSLEELGDRVEKEIMALLDEKYPEEQCHGLQKEIVYQRTALNNLSFDVFPKRSVIEKLDSFLDSESRYLIVHGPEHCGKTATLARWLGTSPRLDGYTVIPFFVGESDASTMESYEEYTRGYLKQLFPPDDEREGELDFQRYTYQLSAGRKLLFVIDGADRFDDGYIHPSGYFPRVRKGSKVIVSSRTDNYLHTDCVRVEDALYIAWEHPEIMRDFDYFMEVSKGKHWDDPVLHEYQAQRIKITALTRCDINRITKASLRKHGKKLTRDQLSLLSKDPKAKDASMLRLLLGTLLYLGTPEELDQRLRTFSELDVDSFFLSLFRRFESVYGRELFRDFLAYVILSRKGLPEKDLFYLLRVPQYRFSQLYFGIRPLLADKFGYLTVAHERIPDVFWMHYPEVNADDYRNSVIDYYFERNEYERCKMDRNSWLWKFDLPYECKAARNTEDLYSAVLSPQVALSEFRLVSWGEMIICGEIVDYWRFLLESGQNYTPEDYLENPDVYLECADLALVYILDLCRCLWDAKKSLKIADRVVEIYSSHGMKYARAILVTYLKMVTMYKEKNVGGISEAEYVLVKALDLCRQVVGSMDVSSFLSNIRRELKAVYGDSTERAKVLDEEIFSIVSGYSDDESYVMLYHEVVQSLSYHYLKEGDCIRALEKSEEALRVSEKYVDKDLNGWILSGDNVAFDHYTCARVLKHLCQYEKAREHARAAFDYYARVDDSMVGEMRNNVKSLLEELGPCGRSE
jgi:preprotein translocase subunit SecA/nephrocystin-3